MDVFIDSFNNQCTEILDKVAPVNPTKTVHKKHCPWMNETIQSMKRNCRNVERLWKTSKLEIHRLHLKDQIASLNELLKNTRTQYFSDLLATNKKTPKILFDIIHAIVSPSIPEAAVFCKTDSNEFLNFFVNRIADIRANASQTPSNPALSDPPPSYSWSSFNPVSLHDIKCLLEKLKPSSRSMNVLYCALYTSF